MRYAMAIDLTRCTGCNACAMACKVSNNLPKDVWWNVVHTDGGEFNDTARGEYGANHMLFYPQSCMHCANPSCVSVCPTGATYVREDGIIAMNNEACIGCRACMDACPYDVRRYIENDPEFYTDFAIGDPQAPAHRGGTVEKCDFCAARIDRGEKPACMVLCPGRARYYGDLDDPTSEISRVLEGRTVEVLNPEAGTDPSVLYFS